MRFPQTKWLEMLGLVPASLFLAPLIAAGAAGTFLAMVTWLFQDTPPLRVRLAIIGGISELLLLMLSALLGLAAAWLTLVFRPEIVGEKRSRRWISQICLILGICAGVYWLHRMGTPAHYINKYGITGWLLWMLLLVPPIVVGVRQLYLLSERKPADPNDRPTEHLRPQT